MHKRIGLVAAGAAVGLAAIAGCSGSGSGGSGNASGSAGGASGGSSAVQLSPAAFIKAALTKATNDKTVHVTGTITGPSSTSTFTSDDQFSPTVEMSLTLGTSQTNIKAVMVGDAIYMKLPQLGSMLGGKPWAELKLSSMGSLGSAYQSMLGSVKNSDPTQQLEPLLASGDLRKVGTETVDGVQADHYSGTVDTATELNSVQATKNLTPDQLAQIKSMLQADGVTKETFDVWISSDGLLVRQTVSAMTSDGPTKTDMHLSDWGKPVSISAPPADQVTDISSLAGNLGAGTS